MTGDEWGEAAIRGLLLAEVARPDDPMSFAVRCARCLVVYPGAHLSRCEIDEALRLADLTTRQERDAARIDIARLIQSLRPLPEDEPHG